MAFLSKYGSTNPELHDLMEEQLRESKDNAGCAVTCPCGTKAPMRFMFRCYYCGVWYCFKCAAVHFGMTREEYYQKKAEGK